MTSVDGRISPDLQQQLVAAYKSQRWRMMMYAIVEGGVLICRGFQLSADDSRLSVYLLLSSFLITFLLSQLSECPAVAVFWGLLMKHHYFSSIDFLPVSLRPSATAPPMIWGFGFCWSLPFPLIFIYYQSSDYNSNYIRNLRYNNTELISAQNKYI